MDLRVTRFPEVKFHHVLAKIVKGTKYNDRLVSRIISNNIVGCLFDFDIEAILLDIQVNVVYTVRHRKAKKPN